MFLKQLWRKSNTHRQEVACLVMTVEFYQGTLVY